MSDTVCTKGIMAELKIPLSGEDRDEISDELYCLSSNLNINYEGTLLIQSETTDIYGITWNSSNLYRGTMLEEIKNLPESLRDKLDIKEETSKTFSEVWYNGGDSEHSTITLEEFKKIQDVYSKQLIVGSIPTVPTMGTLGH